MRYTRLYFADEGLDLFHEIDPYGYAERYIVIEKATRKALNAASRTEIESLDERARARYEAKFGIVPTLRTEGHVPPPSFEEVVTEFDFEQVWDDARLQLEERWSSSPHLREGFGPDDAT